MSALAGNLLARIRSRMGFRILVSVLVLALLAVLAFRLAGRATGGEEYNVPGDPGMENDLGIKVTQAALVADTGIVEIRYTVLDAQKASNFQNDVHNPPVLHSEHRSGDVYRAALMKQGHELQPGQTYYILYLNNQNAIHRGENIEIESGNNHLRHVPVR
jgi:hypothetical protein